MNYWMDLSVEIYINCCKKKILCNRICETIGESLRK
jgi:hypothetical protein